MVKQLEPWLPGPRAAQSEPAAGAVRGRPGSWGAAAAAGARYSRTGSVAELVESGAAAVSTAARPERAPGPERVHILAVEPAGTYTPRKAAGGSELVDQPDQMVVVVGVSRSQLPTTQPTTAPSSALVQTVVKKNLFIFIHLLLFYF